MASCTWNKTTRPSDPTPGLRWYECSCSDFNGECGACPCGPTEERAAYWSKDYASGHGWCACRNKSCPSGYYQNTAFLAESCGAKGVTKHPTQSWCAQCTPATTSGSYTPPPGQVTSPPSGPAKRAPATFSTGAARPGKLMGLGFVPPAGDPCRAPWINGAILGIVAGVGALFVGMSLKGKK
jgi:hypothetical protein